MAQRRRDAVVGAAATDGRVVESHVGVSDRYTTIPCRSGVIVANRFVNGGVVVEMGRKAVLCFVFRSIILLKDGMTT